MPAATVTPVATDVESVGSPIRLATVPETRAHESRPLKVADIKVDREDSRGEKVETIYAVKDYFYVVYLAKEMMVHFADDWVQADDQRTEIANLAGLRARLAYLTSELRCVKYFRSQEATALRLALDGKPELAKEVMAQAVANAEQARASGGRVQYLLCGFATSLIFLAVFGVGYYLSNPSELSKLNCLWLAAVGGTVGAFFSVSVSIRSRTVALDLYRSENIYDGVLRVLIGVIAAAALTLLLSTGVLPELKVGAAAITGPQASWEAVIIAGFIAGFLERLLPDLLEGRQGATRPAS